MTIKRFLITAGLVAISTAALADPSSSTPGSSGSDDKQSRREQKFDERKADMLKRMDERMAEMQKKRSCVSSAANPEAIRACFPNRGERDGDRRGRGGEHNPGSPGDDTPGQQ